MRIGLLALLLLLAAPVPASAQVSIGITISSYPHFVAVPGYPVYYAPDIDSNFFFYDGLYWVYQGDRWYSSSWYNGPWDDVDPMYVPIYVLQVPVRYYRRPPVYFHGWLSDRAPRWGEHWGRDWDQRRPGWDRPQRNMAPAPLPDYQRQYRGNSYPSPQQQRAVRDQNYRYRPSESGARPSAGPRLAKPQEQRRAPDTVQRPQVARPQIEQRSQAAPQSSARPQPTRTRPQPTQRPGPGNSAARQHEPPGHERPNAGKRDSQEHDR